jgi:hypothetical protein
MGKFTKWLKNLEQEGPQISAGGVSVLMAVLFLAAMVMAEVYSHYHHLN